jgi:sulfate/thiosulfate transport system permease protein
MADLRSLPTQPNTPTTVGDAASLAGVPRPATRPGFNRGVWGLRAMAISYLALFILVPLFVITVQGFREGLEAFVTSITRPAALHALGLTLWTSAVMVVINAVMGTLTAYVLVAYKFPGKALLNLIVDLPLAIPPLVTGVMLVLLYGPQSVIGTFFEKQLGFKVIFAPPGIIIALLFIAYPSVIRAVQPVMAALDVNQQEAAHTLGASGWTTFRRVIFPELAPAILTGSLVSFARALGEFGSAVIVAGNLPMKTQTATVYVYAQVEGDRLAAASSVSFVLLFIAFSVTLLVDLVLRREQAGSVADRNA